MNHMNFCRQTVLEKTEQSMAKQCSYGKELDKPDKIKNHFFKNIRATEAAMTVSLTFWKK